MVRTRFESIVATLIASRWFLRAKFLVLLGALSWKMYWKSSTDTRVQAHLGDKHIVFQIQTQSGRVCRHFLVSKQRIYSHWGAHSAPDLVISFADAVVGTRIMTANGKRLAFMQGMQNQELTLQGDLSLFAWYVELGSMLNQ